MDTDFEQRHRQLTKKLTAKAFGEDKCCGINAFGKIKDKRATQDSLRAYGFDSTFYTKVSKLIKPVDGNIMNDVLSDGRMKEEYAKNPDFKKALDTSVRITGKLRQAGTHAAGLLIVPKNVDLFRKMPVMIVGKDKINTQYDKTDVEHAGFLKMDLLGLRNLDIIKDAISMIKEFEGIVIKPETIPLNDEKTFELYRNAETDFVFQFESPGMKSFLKDLKPTDIEDLIVANAGYRPGPMAYLPEYIKVKNGEKPMDLKHELLRPIIGVTKGIPFYQEQIMDIFVALAGYSRGRADLVRRAMGKKDKAILAQEKANFIHGIVDEDGNIEVPGCVRNGIDAETAEAIYDMMVPFADYGFGPWELVNLYL